jgi:hypothetical protein
MSNQWDLTNENIENTYQRVLQTPDGVNIYDGTGSLFYLGVFNNTSTGSFGSFYDTGSQTAVSNTVIYSMSLSTTDISNGVYVSGSDRTRIYFTNAGVYNIQFSAQFSNTGNNPDDVSIWIRKNDIGSINDIPDSSGVCTVPAKKGSIPGQLIASWNYYLTLAAGDFVQLCWHTIASNEVTLETIAASTNPPHPRTPSLILTANRIDTFLSNTGSFSGSFIGTHTGSFTGSFTGSLLGTASWADSASQALTASFYQETDPIFVAKSASLATTGSNSFNGNQIITGSLTVTGSAGSIIEVSSSNSALRITQLGSGEAIRVEDSNNPDITSFIVDSSGSVGVGQFGPTTFSAPLYPIHVIASGGADARLVFDGKQLGNAAANANITIAADTDDKVASFDFFDRKGVGYATASLTYAGPTVKFLLDRSGSSAPLATGNRRNDFHIINGFADRSIIFYTSASDGNTSATVAGKPRLTITGSNVGIGTTNPRTILHVISGSSSNASIQTSDTAVFESNANTYVSIYSPTASNAGLQFGSGGTGGDALGSYIRWNQANNLMTLGTANDGDDISFITGNETSSMYLKNNIGLGIGTTAPLYRLHVRNGAVTNSSTFAGSVGVFENSGSNAFVSILSHTGYSSGVGFGSNVHRSSARLAWTHDSLNFSLATNTGSAFLTFGTDAATERMRITSGGLVGIGTTTPQYLLDVNGSARVTDSLIVTGSISTYFTTASQETFSSASYVSGDIIQGTVVGVSQYDLAYLNIDGTWQHVDQTSDTSTKMLGIYLGGDQILIDGNISATTAGVGTPIGVDIMNPNQGLPVYIDSGSSYDFNTIIPTSNYIRTLGYVYYNNAINANNWILKFRPSTDWYKI